MLGISAGVANASLFRSEASSPDIDIRAAAIVPVVIRAPSITVVSATIAAVTSAAVWKLVTRPSA